MKQIHRIAFLIYKSVKWYGKVIYKLPDSNPVFLFSLSLYTNMYINIPDNISKIKQKSLYAFTQDLVNICIIIIPNAVNGP